MTTRGQHAQRMNNPNRNTGIRPWHVGAAAGGIALAIIASRFIPSGETPTPPTPAEGLGSTPATTASQYPGTPSASPSTEVSPSVTPSATETTPLPTITTLAPKPTDPNAATRRLIAARNTGCDEPDFTAKNGGKTLDLSLRVTANPDSLAAREGRSQKGPISWSDQRVVAIHLGKNGKPEGRPIVATGDAGNSNTIENVDLTLHAPKAPGDIYGIFVETDGTDIFEGKRHTTVSGVFCGTVTDASGAWRPGPADLPTLFPDVIQRDLPPR